MDLKLLLLFFISSCQRKNLNTDLQSRVINSHLYKTICLSYSWLVPISSGRRLIDLTNHRSTFIYSAFKKCKSFDYFRIHNCDILTLFAVPINCKRANNFIVTKSHLYQFVY
ncbi:hypothetical protein EGW08_010007 [Elysia chlorotica]|uniref:Uncharacterized protein n=1 Tax=Elysia chlorotica TaxID=188477 RepID=A0A433TL46_ELYCH|nr:hypothetical protein EGW08_010007 [Elysia chlorotica]